MLRHVTNMKNEGRSSVEIIKFLDKQNETDVTEAGIIAILRNLGLM